ncbi:hypothetical protein BG005_003812 [Podila minutissima]|nr:hypothetical protein BG005_003812 [Podila minutissima]
MFVSSAWEDMLKAYNLPGYKPSTLDIYKGIDPWITTTISDILNQGWRMRNKIEKLLVMVKTFTLSEMDASVIHIYANLNQVAVFSFSSESLYINITAPNIDRIFQPRAPVYLLSQESSPRSGDSQILSSPDLSQRKRRLGIHTASGEPEPICMAPQCKFPGIIRTQSRARISEYPGPPPVVANSAESGIRARDPVPEFDANFWPWH